NQRLADAQGPLLARAEYRRTHSGRACSHMFRLVARREQKTTGLRQKTTTQGTHFCATATLGMPCRSERNSTLLQPASSSAIAPCWEKPISITSHPPGRSA